MDDFPDPETPVTTTSLFFGKRRSMFLRLLLRAPLMKISCLLALRGALTLVLPVFDFTAAFLAVVTFDFDVFATDLEGVLAEAAIEENGIRGK